MILGQRTGKNHPAPTAGAVTALAVMLVQPQAVSYPMMTFRDQSWQSRFKEMGDTAEGVFQAVAPLGKYERLGWNRPAVSLTLMSPAIRHMPDYYSGGKLVEVMGLGRDGILKLKTGKWEALKFWNKTGNEVVMFLWNSHKKTYALVEWSALVSLTGRARRAGIQAFENDGNEYYPIRWADIVDTCDQVVQVIV